MTDVPPPPDRDWCDVCWSRHNGGHIVGSDHADEPGVCDGCGSILPPEKLFVYGTLKDEGSPAVLEGFVKRSDGPFPTIQPEPGYKVEGEVIDVDDIADLDRYEGCEPRYPNRSLYWRLPIVDGSVHVYIGNPEHGRYLWQDQSWGTDYTRDEVAEALKSARLVCLGETFS